MEEKKFITYNALWEMWGKQDIVTKWDMFMALSKGHNRMEEYKAYDVLLRFALNEEFGLAVSEQKSTAYNKRCAAPFIQLVNTEYKNRFMKAVGKIECQQKCDLLQKYPGVTCYTYRQFFTKEEQEIVKQFVWDKTVDTNSQREVSEGYFTL